MSCEDIMFERQVDNTKMLNILYDDVEQHYHVIVNLTGATARKYVCKGCNKACTSDVTHDFGQTCSECMACHRALSRAIVYLLRNATDTLEDTYFAIHKQSTKQKPYVWERKR